MVELQSHIPIYNHYMKHSALNVSELEYIEMLTWVNFWVRISSEFNKHFEVLVPGPVLL